MSKGLIHGIDEFGQAVDCVGRPFEATETDWLKYRIEKLEKARAEILRRLDQPTPPRRESGDG